MRTLLLNLALAFPLAIVAALGSAAAQDIPTTQQKSPATFDQYPYRPACRQLTAAPGRADGWFAWGPTVEGEHQNWRGIEANVPPEQAYERLATVGLCVQGGELVPLSAIEADETLTPMECNLRDLRAKADGTVTEASDDDGFSAFMLLMLVMFGGVHLWEKLEERSWVKKVRGDRPSTPFDHLPPSSFDETTIPDRVSPENLGELSNSPDEPRSALQLLAASPFISRAVFGAQRTGKTNLVAAVMQQLRADGTEVFVINLSSVDIGGEDSAYWGDESIRVVRGDLETVANAEEAKALIDRAIALIDEFMAETGPSVLVVDEWSAATASYAEYVDLLAPLIKQLAGKITAFASTGMKRRKAIWTIAPEIVATTMEDFGKAVKKLSLVLVAIAPGHVEQWEGQELTFDSSLLGQCRKNYGAIDDAPTNSADSRIAFMNGRWVALGTPSLVTVDAGSSSRAAARTEAEAAISALPSTMDGLTDDLKLFYDWLEIKAGEVISYKTFNNANKLKPLGRSRENYDLYCDKGAMKGWLSPREGDSYLVIL